MVTLAESLVSSTSRPLLLRMRPDLSARRHRYHGRTFWVIKEPVGLSYFRFHEEEYAILGMLDGRTSLEEIKDQFESQFAPQKIAYSDLLQFVGMLHRSGLVISESAGQGRQLVKRRDDKKWRELMGKLSNVFALRFRGVDPERFLNWLYQYTGWFFRWPAVVCVLLFALSAVALVTVQFAEVSAKLPTFQEFFAARNWIYLAITMGTVKVLHEFGHGLSCKHFGGECHELGAMMLVFTPALYCNVSDSWMLPNKFHRAAIGAAGMYVELFLASCATYLWWFSDSASLVNQISLSVMFICSVSTIVFNGNPLLRFDGYYILMDLIEIPNLRQKSTEVTKRFFMEYCLGIEQPENPFLPQGNRWLFGLFTVAAVIYRWVVVFSIMFFLNKVFEPYGLKIIGQIIALSGLVGLIVQPVWQFGKFLYTPGSLNKVKTERMMGTAGVAVVALAFFFFVPLPHSVKVPFEVQIHNASPVVANVKGQLAEVKAYPGDAVKTGDPLLVLANPALEFELRQAEGRLKDAEVMHENLKIQSFRDPESIKQMEQAEKVLATAAKQFKEKQAEVERLIVRSPADGTIIAMPERSEKAAKTEGRLATWSGNPFSPKNLGAHFVPNDPICEIGDPQTLEVKLTIDQTIYNLVKSKQHVKILLDAHTGKSFTSKLDLAAGQELKYINPALSIKGGGRVNTVTDKSGQMRPQSTSYPAMALLSPEAGKVQVGLQGQARIYTDWQTLSSRVFRYVAKTFHFDL